MYSRCSILLSVLCKSRRYQLFIWFGEKSSFNNDYIDFLMFGD